MASETCSAALAGTEPPPSLTLLVQPVKLCIPPENHSSTGSELPESEADKPPYRPSMLAIRLCCQMHFPLSTQAHTPSCSSDSQRKVRSLLFSSVLFSLPDFYQQLTLYITGALRPDGKSPDAGLWYNNSTPQCHSCGYSRLRPRNPNLYHFMYQQEPLACSIEALWCEYQDMHDDKRFQPTQGQLTRTFNERTTVCMHLCDQSCHDKYKEASSYARLLSSFASSVLPAFSHYSITYWLWGINVFCDCCLPIL